MVLSKNVYICDNHLGLLTLLHLLMYVFYTNPFMVSVKLFMLGLRSFLLIFLPSVSLPHKLILLCFCTNMALLFCFCFFTWMISSSQAMLLQLLLSWLLILLLPLSLTELVSCRDEFHMELISTRHKFRERLFASLVSKQCFFCKIVLKIKLLSKIPLLTPLIQLSLIIQCCNGLMCDTCQTWNGWLHVHASCIPLLVQRIF